MHILPSFYYAIVNDKGAVTFTDICHVEWIPQILADWPLPYCNYLIQKRNACNFVSEILGTTITQASLSVHTKCHFYVSCEKLFCQTK